MGRAFHRKKMAVHRGGGTRGVGIYYTEPTLPVVRDLTPAQIAAREADDKQQVALEDRRRLEQRSLGKLLHVAEGILRAWKTATDRADAALTDFPGWTTGEFCAFPVDAGVADFYATRIREYREFVTLNGLRFSVEDLDKGIQVSNRRRVSTDQTVEDAVKVIRRAGQDSFIDGGFDLHGFINRLENRADRVPHLGDALDVVCDGFERVARGVTS